MKKLVRAYLAFVRTQTKTRFESFRIGAIRGLWSAVALASLSATSFGATVSTAPMFDFDSGTPVGEGSISTIIRDAHGVTITIHTENLDPGPHSVWVLVWNSPENCTNGEPNCLPPPNGSDPFDSVMGGSGTVVGDSGKGNFGFRINVGDTSGVIGGALQTGLTNPMGAEIHLIIADHLEIIPGELVEQLSSPGDSGCGGPCPRVQFAVHEPGASDAVGAQLQTIQNLLERIALRQGLKP